MPDALIVPTFLSLLQAFSVGFTSPSFDSFVTLMTGWVLDRAPPHGDRGGAGGAGGGSQAPQQLPSVLLPSPLDHT